MALSDKETKTLDEMLQSGIAYQRDWLPAVRWAANNDAPLEDMGIPPEYASRAAEDYAAQKAGVLENVAREGKEFVSGIADLAKVGGKSLVNAFVEDVTAGTRPDLVPFADTPKIHELSSELVKGGVTGTVEGLGGIMQDPAGEFSSKPISSVLSLLPPVGALGAAAKARKASSVAKMSEALDELAKETAAAQQQKLASIRGTKQLEKEAKPKRFKVEEEEPGEFIQLVEPEIPTAGAKTANPLIGLDEPAEITPVSAKLKELQKEIGPDIYKGVEKPLVTPVVGPIVSEDVAPISNELLRQFAEDVARRGKKARPQSLADVPEPIYKEAVKRVNELMSTLTPERRATFTEANINNQIRNTISSIMQEQAEATAIRSAPRLDYIEQFRGMSEGDVRKTIVQEMKELIESGNLRVTPEDKVKYIEDRVQKIMSEVEEAPKGSVGAMRATPVVAPGEFLGIKEKLPTETDRAVIATDYIKRRAKEKNPDLFDDELPEVEYIPEERQMIIRDPLLPAAESTLVLDDNGILKGQWQTEYTRPVGRGKTVTEKTKAFTATDALDAAMYTFGDEVKGLEGIWTKRKGLTTNTDEFEKTVNELIDSGLSREEAELDTYFATNTGRKMAKYGYTEVNPIEVDFDIVDGRPVYNEVRVQFLKPARKSLNELARDIAGTDMPPPSNPPPSPRSKVVGDVDSKQVDYPEISADELEEVDRFHPVFEEAKRSADKFGADEGYKLALERFNPLYKFEKADGLVLVQSGLVPLQVPVRGMPGIQKPSKWMNPDEDFYNVTSKLGEGAFGRAHIVVDETGAKKVAKISAPAIYDEDMAGNLRHERNVALEMQKLRKNATKEDQKYLRHFPVIEKVMPNPLDPKNGFVFVMKELRPMNDYEQALLFKGRKFAEDEVLNLDEPYLGKSFDFPTSWRARRALTSADYENMPPNVRKFYKSLEWLADTHNIKWDDLHDGNVMIDPVTNEYVALDMGQFSLKGEVPPGAPMTGPSTGTRQKAAEQAAIERGRKSSSTSEMALEIARQGLEEIKSGKPRGMVMLPFGGKGKPKQLPEKTQSSQTTAMVPSLTKEMQLAGKGPSLTERLGKTSRSLQGSLTVDEFRTERKMLEDELKFAEQKLNMAKTETEIRAAERAQNSAYLKLQRFKKEYPDVDDLLQLVNDLDRRETAIATRFNRGDHLKSKQAADALSIDTEAMISDQVAIAEKIRDIFARYPELYDELPRSHPLIRAYEELPEVETRAFAESRGLMGRLEEMLGLKKR
jgi:hypothetical protein